MSLDRPASGNGGLDLRRSAGRLSLDGQDLCALADRWGTPLYVVSAATVRHRCRELIQAFATYPGRVAVHYSYKTNSLAAIAALVHAEGIGAEVASGYELWLARRLALPGSEIVFGGPNKSADEVRDAISSGVGLIVVDGAHELDLLEKVGSDAGARVPIALRVCPDVVPRRMNPSSVTGSRRTQFGMDMKSGEFDACAARAVDSPHLAVRGVMAHIGSGIHDMRSFERMVDRLLRAQAVIWRLGGEPDLIDVGGGLGARRSRELGRFEMLRYLGFGRLPPPPKPAGPDLVPRYAAVLEEAVLEGCRSHGIAVPSLLLEPGRALVSDSQVLVLRVGAVRDRPGIGRFALTDGGAMTVSMMFLSELHEVCLANREAPADGRTSVFGRLPSPMDVVYRNLPLPRLERDDLLAVLDAGAYFTATETCFGGMRPPVVLLGEAGPVVVRRRETYEERAASQPL